MQQNPTQDMQPQLSAVCSMTGYGRARQMIGNKEITVELRSVNHRFLEYSSRVPRAYAYLEDKLKNLVKGSVSRGKVEVTLSVQTISGTDTQVVINHDLARSYLEALRDLAEDLQIKNDVSVSQMARFSDIFSVVKVEENEEDESSEDSDEDIDIFADEDEKKEEPKEEEEPKSDDSFDDIFK